VLFMVRVARFIDSLSSVPGLHFLSKYAGEILAAQSRLDAAETTVDDHKRHLREVKDQASAMPGATGSKYGPGRKGGERGSHGDAGAGSLRRAKSDGGVAPAPPKTESLRKSGPSNVERLEEEKHGPGREPRDRLRRRNS